MPAFTDASDGAAGKEGYLKNANFDDDDIVISGMSGRFPEANSVEELKKNLYEGIDMISENDRRWRPGLFGSSRRTGKLMEIDKFDSMFFGCHGRLASVMDPQQRILLEATYEAIFDSGYDPNQLRGKNIGVYVGCSEKAAVFFNRMKSRSAGYEIVGMNLGMMANRISYDFDFKGPSLTLDTACSSSVYALNEAILAIKQGRIEAAIVAGSTISLDLVVALGFAKLGLNSPDGKCKVFDAGANGYVRSEGIGVLFLQKSKQARRIYSTIVHCRVNNDGKKNQGITFPSSEVQRQLYKDVYNDLNIHPRDIDYLETHGTGTVTGDREETNGVAEFFLKERDSPLLIGSIKSNLGHSEAASGIQAIMKVLLSMEEGAIPPNLHFNEPNPEIPALVEKKLLVVDKVTPWEGKLAAVNNFGFGGSNGHVVLKRNERIQNAVTVRTIPRLVLVNGRKESAVQNIFKRIKEESYSDETLTLLEYACKGSTSGMQYRGYTLLGTQAEELESSIKPATTGNHPVWFMFTGMGSQWSQMAKDMMKLDIFANSIKKSAQVLKPYGVDLLHLLLHASEEELSNVLAPFVTIAAVQIALVDIVKVLGLEPDGIVGHSLGELGCAYADGCFTAEQMLKVAYWRGKSCEMSKLIKGAMAAVGLSWEEISKRCPEGVYPVCNNSEDSVTISGPYNQVHEFVEKLKAENIFARVVKSCDIAFHSKYIKPAAAIMKTELIKIIPNPLPRSQCWISSSVPESDWEKTEALLCSAEYHVNNLLSPVLFNEAMSKVPKDAIIIEFAPHSFFEAIVKRIVGKESMYTGLMKRGHEDNLRFFLTAIARLYTWNLNPNASKLYGEVQFPVSRGTPMLSSLIQWDHAVTWPVQDFMTAHGEKDTFEYDTMKGMFDEYLLGHKVDGRTLFPATGYLELVINTLGMHLLKNEEELPVLIEDIMLFRATLLPKTGVYALRINRTSDTGYFEIMEGSSLVVSGRIRMEEGEVLRLNDDAMKLPEDDTYFKDTFTMSGKDFYKEARLRGYEYGPDFQGVLEAESSGIRGRIKWENRWVTFMDAMLQIPILLLPRRALLLPIRIKSIRIDPRKKPETTDEGVPFMMNPYTNTMKAGPVEIQGLCAGISPRKLNITEEPVLEKHVFSPFFDYCTLSEEEKDLIEEYSHVCTTLASRFLKEHLKMKDVFHLSVNGLKEASDEVVRKYLDDKDKRYAILKVLKDILYPESVEEEPTESSNDNDKNMNVTVEQTVHNKSNKPERQSQNHLGSKEAEKLKETDKTGLEQETKEPLSPEELFKNSYRKHLADMNRDLLSTAVLNERGLRTALDVVQENTPSTKMVILEVSAQAIIHSDVVRMLNMSTLGMVRNEYSVCRLDSEPIPDGILNPSVTVHNGGFGNGLPSENDLVVAKDLFTDTGNPVMETLASMLSYLKPNGFLLLVERTRLSPVEKLFAVLSETKKIEMRERNLEQAFLDSGLVLVAKKKGDSSSVIYLLRKLAEDSAEKYLEPSVVRVPAGSDHSWIEMLQTSLKSTTDNSNPPKIWLVAQESNSGILGFYNCAKLETGGKYLRLYMTANTNCDSAAPNFDLSDPDIKRVVRNDLRVNIYRDQKWGQMSHQQISADPALKDKEFTFMNVTNRGDMSSVKWIESQLKHHSFLPSTKENILVQVYYAPLNFRDVMIASGKLPPDALPREVALEECILGLEFAGRDETGRRVMGLRESQAMATVVSVPKDALFEIPEEWTMEEASTVPVVYLTAFYAMIIRGKLRKGETILIHSGTGGVGQAAISIALNKGCTVFVTVGNAEKREFLKQTFPELNDAHIYNSRDEMFEMSILNATKGRGVDVVLNSLAGSKLQASFRCLKKHGRFLEIGKFDSAVDNKLGMNAFLKNITFHGVHLDALFGFKDENKVDMEKCIEKLKEGMKSGAVRPIKANVFNYDQGEEAFRFMASGKHIGKVVIKIRDEEDNRLAIPKPMLIPSVPRTYCHPEKCYIVTGGLGGFGFELGNWLIQKGARKVILCSRTEIKNDYQRWWWKNWQREEIQVKISNQDITTEEGVKELIREATELGPVDGIFHLALVLHDGLFENMKVEDFDTVWGPKATAVKHLDKISRDLCPELSHFVVFSSISCGRGNPGQSNYGYANSVMERVVEQRKAARFPGLAIQWGGIGDVGVVYEHMGGNEVILKGSVPQRLGSCLTVLDRLMQGDDVIVSSFVPAEKAAFGFSSEKDLVDMMCQILGIKDPGSVKDEMTLSELGMDSLMAVEVKQVLESEYDTVKTATEIRNTTIKELKTISEKKNIDKTDNLYIQQLDRNSFSIMDLVIPTEVLTNLNKKTATSECVFFVHSLERHTEMLRDLASRIDKPAYGINFTDDVPHASLKDIVRFYVNKIKSIQPHGPYHIVGCTTGGMIAFEIALQLQEESKVHTLIFLDGSPARTLEVQDWKADGNDKNLSATTFMKANFRTIPGEKIDKFCEGLKLSESSDKVEVYRLIETFNLTTPPEVILKALDHTKRLCLAMKGYKPSGLFKGTVTLVKATEGREAFAHIPVLAERDYGIQKHVEGTVKVLEMKCTQMQIILEKAEATSIIINSRETMEKSF